MEFKVEELKKWETTTEINGKWILMRPIKAFGFLEWQNRIKDALKVLKGKADIVTWYKQ